MSNNLKETAASLTKATAFSLRHAVVGMAKGAAIGVAAHMVVAPAAGAATKAVVGEHHASHILGVGYGPTNVDAVKTAVTATGVVVGAVTAIDGVAKTSQELAAKATVALSPLIIKAVEISRDDSLTVKERIQKMFSFTQQVAGAAPEESADLEKATDEIVMSIMTDPQKAAFKAARMAGDTQVEAAKKASEADNA